MNKTWKAVFGVILIYIFGCFSGAVSISIFFHHKMLESLQHPALTASKALEKRLTGNLNLDANQKQQVDDCFRDNLQQRKELQKQVRPQVQALNLQMIQQVAAVLRPDQTELFHQNVEKFREHLGASAFNPNVKNLFSPVVPQTGPATNSSVGNPPAAQ